MRTKRRRWPCVLSAGALALGLAACGGDDESGGGDAGGAGAGGAAAEPVSLTLGLIPIVDVAPVFLGIDQGFFEEEGLQIETQFAAGGAAIVPAVISGDFQVGFSNNVSLLVASTEGLPIQIVSPGVQAGDSVENDFCAVYSAEGSDITEPADLAGATVSINTLQNIGDVTISEALSQQGVDFEAVEFVEVPFPDAVNTLESGDVDAVWVCEPFATQAEEIGAQRVLSNYVETAPKLSIATYFVNQQYAEENPEVIERFTRAMDRSLEYASQNPDAVRAAVTDYAEVEQETAEELRLPFWSTDLNQPSIELLGQLSQKYGLIEEEPDYGELIRP